MTFSTQAYLDKKTGPHGIGRASYLQSIVTEFQDTDSEDSKLQILANLANFAYDPINYEILRQLNVLDLFLDCLTDPNPALTEYAISGICNCAADAENREYFVRHGGARLVVGCLSSERVETVISAITAIIFLSTSSADLTSLPVVNAMLRLSQSRNPRVSNLANVYLTDCCNAAQVEAAKSFASGGQGNSV